MSEFPRTATRRLFRVVNGGTPRADAEFWDGEVAWATPVDLGAAHGRVLTATGRTLTKAGLEIGSRTVPAGSLLLSTRAPIGYVSEAGTTMAFNQGCRGLVPQQELDSRFYRYTFVALADELSSYGQGSTFFELPSDSLAEFPIPLPNLHEQRAIADYLDAETTRIDALIEKKRRLVGLLKARFQLEIDHTMDGVASSEAALGRFMLDLSQGSSPQAAGYPAKSDEWGVLKLSAVKFGRYDPQENKAMTEEPDDLTMIPRVGDLLVTRSNTPALVGDVAAVAQVAPRRMLPDLIYRVRLDKNRISAKFAAYALLTSRSRHEISSLARGSSQSMVKLRGEDIRSLPVPVATLDVQERIVKSLECRREQTSEILGKLNRQIELLTEHRQALITAAVSGRVEVPDSTVSQ